MISNIQKPKEYIEYIKNRQLESDKEFVLDSLTGAIDRIQKAFPRYGSFLMEFVQNADDAKSKSLKITIVKNNIRISNNGLVFSKDDVKSICKVGRSSKTPKDYIGYLGVGFKAVFLISECPEIYSGGYQFKFDKNVCSDSEHIPWQVIPIWIDKASVNLTEDQTIFILPIKTSDLVEKIREEVGPEHLNNRILLFLRNIKEIEIIDVNQNLRRKIIKYEFSKTSNYEIYKIREYENDTLKNQDLWLVFRSICNVPADVKKDYLTKEWEREHVEKREIFVSFRLNDQNNLIKEEKGTAHMGVFSFLPLKEIPSGFNFLLQADFLTVPGRSELTRECLWNNWLADEIFNLITDKCISTFLNHKNWKFNFTNILYSSEGGHELFEEHIKKPLHDYLENNAVLIAEDGTHLKNEKLILVNEEIRELLTEDDIKLTYPNKILIHKECRPHSGLEIEKAPDDIHEFILSSESEEFIKQKAKNREIEWFKKLYSMFVEKYTHLYFQSEYARYNVEHDEFWSRMRNLHRPIILTNYYNIAQISDCYIKPKKIQVPRQLKEKFKIVHPQLVKDKSFEDFRWKLNKERHHYPLPKTEVLRELTEDDIRSALGKQETIEMTKETWKNLFDKQRIEKLKEIKKLWSNNYINLENYNFITLKSKDEEWIKPQNLVFSKEYNPDHSIEILIGKGILDFPLKFISSEFIEDYNNNDEIREWLKFFKELGLEKKLESIKNKIIERIAILVAQQYENKNERYPRELGESEKPGYDIESKSKIEERFIEVKGTSDSNCDIFLTVNELKTLRDKKDKYFIYVVTDSLNKPLLRTIKGNRLLEIKDTKIIFPSKKWLNKATDEEFQP